MDENKNKTTGLLISIGFHALIAFLLIVLPGFKLDLPVFGDPIEVELGGGGQSGSNGGNNAQEITPPSAQTTTQETPSTTSDISTDEKGEVTVPKEEKKTKVSPVPTTKKAEVKTEKARVAEKGSIYKGKGSDPNKKPGGGGTEDNGPGSTTGPDPDNGKGPNTGSKIGGGVLKGRTQKQFPYFGTNFPEDGTLVFRITVDRIGNVIDAKYVPPSTITNLEQIKSAREIIMTKVKFNANPDAEEVQTGTYTINYKHN